MTNTLLEKITAEADSQTAAIAVQAEAEVAEIAQETERVVRELRNEAAQQLQKKKDQLELVATAKAKQAAKIATQAAKREAIDALFVQVTDQLLTEASDVYVARYAKRAQDVLPKDAEVVAVAAPANRTDETKQIMSVLGITADLTADSKVRAGLIVTTKDGVYDVSFDRLLSSVRPALEMELINTPS